MNESHFVLDYTPPVDWAFFLHYFSTRSTPGVEVVNDERYIRSVVVDGLPCVLFVEHDSKNHRLIATIQGASARRSMDVEQRLRRMFDLDADMPAIHAALIKDGRLARHIAASPGIRVPGAWSAFEVITRAIVGQQVSVKAASTLIGRIAERFGTPSDVVDGIRRQFPTPHQLAHGDLSDIGMPGKRTQALQSLSHAIATERLPFCDLGQSANGVKDALLEQPGIGPWTAEYFALRALRDTDGWPGTDLILKRQLTTDMDARLSPAQLERKTASWRPWRAYVAMHLWHMANNDSLALKGSQ
ncbi:MAG: 3-methyladenine glycosylase/8-oxoguanine glycosylase [Phycisphaerales bacterium]|nr:3-methyladenine glycosylase/8-oxoguanine glycosylase [Phycisphaerales bacterium]